MLIFKELETAIRSVKAEMKQESEPKALALLKREYDALCEIRDFVKNGKWLQENAKERLLYCLKNNISMAATKYNCTTASISSSMTKYSRKFEKLIGINTISLICSGEVEKGLMQFYFGTGEMGLGKLLVRDFTEIMPKGKKSEIEACECLNEIKLLRIYSKIYCDNAMLNINKDKLALIRYIMESNDPAYVSERAAIFDFLTNSSADMNKLKKELEALREDTNSVYSEE